MGSCVGRLDDSGHDPVTVVRLSQCPSSSSCSFPCCVCPPCEENPVLSNLTGAVSRSVLFLGRLSITAASRATEVRGPVWTTATLRLGTDTSTESVTEDAIKRMERLQ